MTADTPRDDAGGALDADEVVALRGLLRAVGHDTWAGAPMQRGALPVLPQVTALPAADATKGYALVTLRGTPDVTYQCLRDAAGDWAWVRIDTAAVASVPSGAIFLWHGLLADIPTGYVLCDGTNSTPDLTDKFVKGVATAATDPGTTGGAVVHQHSSDGGHTGHGAGSAHSHAAGTLAGASAGGHTHDAHTTPFGGQQDSSGTFAPLDGPATHSTDGAHTHTLSGQAATESVHTHTTSAGAHQHDSVSNAPPYYEVAFIMKS